MDRAGLDYANILQQGLDEGSMNKLLSTIVDYLAEITSTTKDNNVLQSSYAQLFNLSITDMTAIQNLSKMNYNPVTLTGAAAQAKALDEINQVSSRTSAAEAIDNVFNNARFSFGSSIAGNKTAYTLYKTSNFILDAMNSLETSIGGSEGILGKLFGVLSGPVRLVSGIMYLGSLLPGVVGFGRSLGGTLGSWTDGNGYNALADVIAKGSSGGMYDGGTSISAALSLIPNQATSGSSEALKQFSLESTSAASGISDTSTWENDAEAMNEEEDENTKILKEFEKTKKKNKDSDNYAFAVSLQGMSDGVLRSFASIFADEDAMLETMTGKNNALKENNTFISYLDSSTKKSANKTT